MPFTGSAYLAVQSTSVILPHDLSQNVALGITTPEQTVE